MVTPFEKFGGRAALGNLTYRELLRNIDERAEHLTRGGVIAGNLVAVTGEFSSPNLAALLALWRLGAIAIPFVRRPTFSVVNPHFWWDEKSGLRRGEGEPILHPLLAKVGISGGFIVFTSGSTGNPKAILHDTEVFLDKFAHVKRGFRTLPLLQWDHLGGLNTLFSQLWAGGTLYPLPSTKPAVVCRMIEEYRVELLPATPSFLRFLLASGEWRRWNLESLIHITYGTEVMTEELLDRLKGAFPRVVFKQTYGLSELGVLPLKSRPGETSTWSELRGPGVEIKIVDGRLWIRAKSAMLGYLNEPSPFRDGWMDTGDGVSSEGPFLRFLGRDSEIINVGGNKVYPAEVEAVIAEIPNVVEVSVGSEKNSMLGQIVTATVLLGEPEEPSALRRKIRQHCLQKLSSYKVPFKISVTEESLMTERLKKKRPPCATL